MFTAAKSFKWAVFPFYLFCLTCASTALSDLRSFAFPLLFFIAFVTLKYLQAFSKIKEDGKRQIGEKCNWWSFFIKDRKFLICGVFVVFREERGTTSQKPWEPSKFDQEPEVSASMPFVQWSHFHHKGVYKSTIFANQFFSTVLFAALKSRKHSIFIQSSSILASGKIPEVYTELVENTSKFIA